VDGGLGGRLLSVCLLFVCSSDFVLWLASSG
jgi:hypothetical protein